MSETLQLVKTYTYKYFVFLSICVVLLGIIMASAFRLQVIEGQGNLQIASLISSRAEVIRAPRGLIFTNSGEQLVVNEPDFNIYVLPGELTTVEEERELIWQLLANFSGIDKSVIAQRFTSSAYSSAGQLLGQRVTLLTKLTYEDFLANSSLIADIPGVYIGTEAARRYVYGDEYAHILGYVGDISVNEIERFGLDPRARVGKDGLERHYDSLLRGEDGIGVSSMSVTSSESQDWIPKNFESGSNLTLNIEHEWQKSLYKILGKYTTETNSLGGSAVILNAETGAVVSSVNYPSYDNNLFSRGISQNEFEELLNNSATPLLNRSLAMQLPTGSTFKVIMAAALLQEQAISATTTYNSGCFELPGDYKICEADLANYGRLNMIQALSRSSNPYFCQASVALANKFSSDRQAIYTLGDYFDAFGLGKATGIDLPGELRGTMPSPELKERLLGEQWFLADLCNTAIGQGLVSSTPLQMATMTASILNGGKVMKPQILSHSTDAFGRVTDVSKEKVGELNVEGKYLENIREGMRQAVDYGTATGLKGSYGSPLAKTGSAEAQVRLANGQTIKGAHSWVIGGFEHEGEKYAFAVALQFGGRGFRVVPVAKDFLYCLGVNFQDQSCN